MSITTHRQYAAPDALPGAVLIQAEAMWASTAANAVPQLDDATWLAVTDALADLLRLGPGDGHDELTRCDVPDCRAWFWADEGATVHYESGNEITVCARHAVADDPGARVYPGHNLLTALQAQRDAELSYTPAAGQPW